MPVLQPKRSAYGDAASLSSKVYRSLEEAREEASRKEAETEATKERVKVLEDKVNRTNPICSICPIAFCSAFCRSGGLGTRTEQGKCEVVRHVRHVRDGVSTCVLHCVAGVVACCGGPPESVILDVRLRNQKNCFLKRRTSGRALRQKSMKK